MDKLKEFKVYCKKTNTLKTLFHQDKNGLYQGQWEWYDNGQLYSKGIYENNIQIGLWLVYGGTYRYYL